MSWAMMRLLNILGNYQFCICVFLVGTVPDLRITVLWCHINVSCAQMSIPAQVSSRHNTLY